MAPAKFHEKQGKPVPLSGRLHAASNGATRAIEVTKSADSNYLRESPENSMPRTKWGPKWGPISESPEYFLNFR